MYLPGGNGHGHLVRGIAAPQTLDEFSRGLPSPDHVLLSLLLLHLESQPGAQNTLEQIYD